MVVDWQNQFPTLALLDTSISANTTMTLKRFFRSCLSVLSLLVLTSGSLSADGIPPVGGTGGGAMRVMAMGDSNTRGFHGLAGERSAYRYEFSKLMDRSDESYDLVGQYQFAKDGLDDPHHQGIGGQRIEDMTGDYRAAVSFLQPDYVLLLAGTNNHNDTMDYDVFYERYNSLVSMIAQESRETKVIMSTLPKFGCCRPDREHWTEEFVRQRNEEIFPFLNSVIYDVAEDNSHVEVIDFFSIMDPNTDLTADQVHLNSNGHEKLGRLFFNAVTGVPEPGSALLLGLVGCIAFCRRRRA